ncbi:solute carrier family 18 member A2 [Xenopus tropicalis]|uniref:Solute carrier family 18 (Vesicular monoamine), member 2 n=1 Tax=Xenopus tropicalis TaxID=8364 RepID=A0A803KGP7_XENTR|eukprot:XP_017947508.1 PREDICTED: solute carrier family 18 (vesicular monoamine transporter), member 2 isoform X1 [Xenopus tropicalis]
MGRCCPCPCLKEKCDSRWPILFVITVAMIVDCVLFTIVAPIAPAILYDIEYGKGNTTFQNSSGSSSAYPISSYSSLSNLSLFDNSSKEPYHDRITNSTESPGNKRKCYEGTEYLKEQNVRVGLLLAIKAILQLLTNPIVGKLINRTGYDAPLFCGFFIVFLSSLMFAFANSYAFLCVARGLQGIGSSFTMVSAMGMLAHVFPDDAERGKAMGIAMSGVAIGILAGAPFGSVMYEFVGKASPFLAIGVLALLDGVLQLFILRPTKFTPLAIPPTPYRDLVLDPYIMVTAVGLCIANLTFGMLEPTIPIRMMETMCAPRYQLGLSFLPSVITYFICLNAFSGLAQKIGRWLCIMIGMIIQGIGVMFLPLALNIFGLIGPDAALGFGFGLMETSVMPLMAHLVDLRHTSNYGGIYAISDIALCIGYALGPSCGGAIAKALGFTWLMILLGLLNILYAPIFILLRNPPGKEETKPVLNPEEKQEEEDL